MKKTGILTYHFGDNYGALLQCYALRKIINKFDSVYAEIINFNPGHQLACYEDDEVQEKYYDKLKKFKDFNLIENEITKPIISDIYNHILEYDYYITGSDQVWNTSFLCSTEAYFLDFVPKKAKRIAYAASIGLPISSPKLKKEWFERNIPEFDWLSLREKSHIPYVSQFTDKKVYSVVDPTLLLNTEDYDDLCNGVDYPDGDYLLLYYLKHDDSMLLLTNYANMLARKFNLKVVHSFAKVPPNIFKNESETFYYGGPKEFVQAIKHAKVVVTNSFHGTIFSVLYHVPFFTYLVSSMASRITDLLESLGLEDRIVYEYRKLTDDMLDVDFCKADDILEIKRAESMDFLKRALDIDKDN